MEYNGIDFKIDNTFNAIKCNSTLTLKDLGELFNSYVYLEWNDKVLFDDIYKDETVKNYRHVEELIKNKKIYSLEVKIVSSHHVALKITGEEI